MKYGGKTMKVSTWSGGYSKQFCAAVIKGATNALQRIFTRQAYPADAPATTADDDMSEDGHDDASARLPEERFVSPDEVDPGYATDAADISQIVKDTVIKAHCRLGHHTRKTFLRMLRLPGAQQSAIKFAKIWNCPVCEQRAAPGKPRKTKAEIRPYGFNHTLYLDLKFVQDVKAQTYAALSIIDSGTIFHRAVLLKSKTPRLVARKLMRHWISVFGPPKKIIHDQGGEFERDVVAFLEELSASKPK